MKIYRSLRELSSDRPEMSVVTIGTFDGLHLGHAAVLDVLLKWAQQLQATPAVIAFSRPPRSVLSSEGPVDLITSPRHRAELLESLGIELLLELDFNQELAGMEARAFAADYLIAGLNSRGLVLGHDSRFGRGGAAGAPEAVELGRELGFEVRKVPAVEIDQQVVSSSRVRAAVLDGDLPLAERLLGRRVEVMGKVVHGRAHGRQLGFPTVNLDIHREVRPPMGVYASWAHIEGGEALRSVTNVGYRLTMHDRQQPPEGKRPDLLVETYLLEGGRDLYGMNVSVEFVARIRDERRFESDGALAGQIATDIVAAEEILAADSKLS
jgi:riboflavin kinase / FMN adenylyltransferase